MKEIWKDIPSLKGFYMASNLGRVKRLERLVILSNGRVRLYPESILSPSINSKGYVRSSISIENNKKNYRVHRLVAEAFLDNPENKPYINHKNSIRNDNRIENLEWCTVSENNQHGFDFGFSNAKKGESSHFSKIKAEEVKKIYTMSIKGDMMQKDIASMFGITRGHVSSIKLKRNWKELTDKLDKEFL